MALLAGQIITDAALSAAFPLGVVDQLVGGGTNFAATSPNQWERTGLSIASNRVYRVTCDGLFANTAASNVMNLSLQGDTGSGYSELRPRRFSNGPASGSAGSTDTYTIIFRWQPGVTTGSAKLRLVSSRFSGADTFEMGTFSFLLEDIGAV